MSAPQILGRALSVGSAIGVIVGGVIGTAFFPIIGTLFGGAVGAVLGAAFGALNGIVLIAVTHRTMGRGRVRLITAGTSGLCAGGVSGLLSTHIWQVLGSVMACAAVAAIAGPYAAFGSKSHHSGRDDISCRASLRWSSRATAALGGLGALVGFAVGLHVYAPTSPFAALEIGIPSACLGFGLGAVGDLVRENRVQ
jgi:hypothetical protein